ncbi:MAG: hypothetical protein QXU18_09655 [Thermoplasmatales archaeon]
MYGEGAYKCRTDGEDFPHSRSVDKLVKKDWWGDCPICGDKVSPVGIKEEKPPQNLSPYALSNMIQNVLLLIIIYYFLYLPSPSGTSTYMGPSKV